jgi:two-component system OmpR family response regulator
MDPMLLRKILLVDDEADIRLIAEISLSHLGGWQVIQAGSGREALDLALQAQPDLILLDVMMPGMDGPTTLEKLREQEDGRATPVIFMTAKVQKTEIDRLLSLGVRGLIPKPFDPMTLPADIRNILGP